MPELEFRSVAQPPGEIVVPTETRQSRYTPLMTRVAEAAKTARPWVSVVAPDDLEGRSKLQAALKAAARARGLKVTTQISMDADRAYVNIRAMAPVVSS